jgi:hypothetical protein
VVEGVTVRQDLSEVKEQVDPDLALFLEEIKDMQQDEIENQQQYADQISEEVDLKEDTEQTRRERAQERARTLYEDAKKITDTSIAAQYLKEHRAITVATGDDIKTIEIWDRNTKKYFPALVIFAKNSDGEVTGGQKILLDPVTKDRADVKITNAFFGTLKGSFSCIQNVAGDEHKQNRITYIAEGGQTALSLKEIGFEGRILCSVGLGNMINYQARDGEKIIMVTDNVGKKLANERLINKIVSTMGEKGALVEVVQPKEPGSYNDLLIKEGPEAVKSDLAVAISALRIAELERPQVLLETKQMEEKYEPEFASMEQSQQSAQTVEEAMEYITAAHKLAVSAGQEFTMKLERITRRKLTVNESVIKSLEQEVGTR